MCGPDPVHKIQEGNIEMVKTRHFRVCIIALISAMLAALCGAGVLAADGITVEVDGESVSFPDQQPVVIAGRVLVPIRGVFETLGYTVDWDQSEQTAVLTNDVYTVTITVGEAGFINNDENIDLDIPAQVVMGRAMLPFRAVLESIGCGVIWDGDTMTVRVFSDGLPDGAESEIGGDDGPGLEEPPEEPSEPYVLPPRSGRQINPGDRFGVDIHYDSGVAFHGSFYVEPNSIAGYVKALDLYRKILPETGRVFSLLVPSRVEFADKSVSPIVGIQKGAIESIYRKLGEGIITVDAYSKIAERVKSEYLYFRTDHHCTALGGYYAYLAFAEAAGFDPITIYNYLEFAIPNYIGPYAEGSQSSSVLNHPDTIYYYRLNDGTTFSRSLFVFPEDIRNSNYRLFLGGDRDLIEFTTSNKNGRTLIVVKESYANSFIPWVSPHYEKIVVIDPRHYQGRIARFIDKSAETDILVMTAANTPSYPGFVAQMAALAR